METLLVTALLSAILASSIATTGYLARRIDKQGERIDRAEERSHDRHVEVLTSLNSVGERVTRIETRLGIREEATA